MTPLVVLIDEDVWPEFGEAIARLGDAWTAPSGRVLSIALSGRRLEISVVDSAGDLDDDLMAYACAVHDAVGGEWSGENVRQVASLWSDTRRRMSR